MVGGHLQGQGPSNSWQSRPSWSQACRSTWQPLVWVSLEVLRPEPTLRPGRELVQRKALVLPKQQVQLRQAGPTASWSTMGRLKTSVSSPWSAPP